VLDLLARLPAVVMQGPIVRGARRQRRRTR
jgi:hypothetical protein